MKCILNPRRNLFTLRIYIYRSTRGESYMIYQIVGGVLHDDNNYIGLHKLYPRLQYTV